MRFFSSWDGNDPPSWARVAAILYFMGSSMLVQYTTKAIFTVHAFDFPITVAFCQMLFIAPISYAVARPELSWSLARELYPLAFANVCNVAAGLVATAALNVPMFIALRRFTLLATLLLERFWLRKSHDWPTLAAMAVMIGGALVAALSDLSFNAIGYAAVVFNDGLTSLYLILVKNSPAAHTLTTTGLLFYNSLLSLPLLATVLLLRGEFGRVGAFPGLFNPGFQGALFVSSALGLTINHSTMLCTRLNEPLATSVAGNLKNVLMTVIGAVAFGDFIFDPLNVAGLAASMAGAVWFATRSAFKARQRALKSSLLSQVPVIGRDRLKHRASTGDAAYHRLAHSRTGSSANVGALLQLGSETRLGASGSLVQSGNLTPMLTNALNAVMEHDAPAAAVAGGKTPLTAPPGTDLESGAPAHRDR